MMLLYNFQALAQVPVLNHVYQLVCRSTGQSLEIGGGGNLYDAGRNANTWGYWGGAHQQWFFAPYPRNSSTLQGYTIANRNSRLLLSGFDHNAGSAFTQEGGTASASSPYADQIWTLQQVAGNSFVLKLGNYCLTADGNGNVFKQAYDPNNNTMIWDFIDVSANAALNYTQGSFQLINKASTYALSTNPNDASSRGIAPFPSVGVAYQEWNIVPSTTRSDYYYIVPRRNPYQILEIGGGDTNNNATVNLWDNYQHPWQEWAFLDINDSHPLQPAEFTDGRYFKIYSSHAGKVLQYQYYARENARVVEMMNDFGQSNQQWKMKFDSYYRIAAPVIVRNDTVAVISSVQVYPNPATEILSISAGSTFNLSALKVSITDVTGNQVNAPYHNGKVDISELHSGVYVVTISDGKETAHRKFVKI